MLKRTVVILLCLAVLAAAAAPALWAAVPRVVREFALPEFDGRPMRPRISGDWAVAIHLAADNKTQMGMSSKWLGLVVYNLKTPAVYTIFEGRCASWPTISGNLVAWPGRINDVPSLQGTTGRRGSQASSLLVLDLATGRYYAPEINTICASDVCVFGNKAAYQYGSRIYLLDMQTGQQVRISDEQRRHSLPDANGDVVVWSESESAARKQRQVRAYLVSKGQLINVTDDSVDNCIPVTDGKAIVWWTNKGVEVYDVRTGKRSLIAGGFFPDVDNGIVVYLKKTPAKSGPGCTCRSGSINNVFGYDLATGTEFQISKTAADQGPSIDGNRVIWCNDTRLYCAELDRRGSVVRPAAGTP